MKRLPIVEQLAARIVNAALNEAMAAPGAPGGPMHPQGYEWAIPGGTDQSIPYYTPSRRKLGPPTKDGKYGVPVYEYEDQQDDERPNWVKPGADPRPTHDWYGNPIYWW